jgi:hypothetical protein
VRIPSCMIVVTILSAVFIAGCGSEPEVTTSENRPTDITPFKGMIEKQAGTLKGADKLKGAEKAPAPKP